MVHIRSWIISKNPTGLTLDQALEKSALYMGGGTPKNAFDKVDQSAAHLPEIKKATQTLVPNLISLDKIPMLHFTDEESTKLGTYAQDIQNYINEKLINFITGKRSFQTMDQYVAGLNKMDIKGYKAIYQAAYDRWKNN